MIMSDTQLKLIIIDDDETYREVLARSLTRLSCHVQHFAHPQDSLDSISITEQPVVLLDLKLENDSGLRWIKKIREIKTDSFIILLTGFASISTAVEAIKLGADDYLAKPITAREILTQLQKGEIGEDTPISQNPMSVERLEWEHIQKVLQDNEGARALGMHRRTLQRKLAKKPARS